MPGSFRAWAISTGEEHYRAWAEVLYSVHTGKSAFEQVFGMGVYDYRAHHPEAAAQFNEGMTDWTREAAPAVVAAYDFSTCTRVVDVGGGQGDLLIALLQAYPHLQGVLVERPHVAAAATPRLEAAGLASRCEVVAGDFFEALPAAATSISSRTSLIALRMTGPRGCSSTATGRWPRRGSSWSWAR